MMRGVLKAAFHLCAVALVSPLVVPALIEGRLGRSQAVYDFAAQLLALVPGHVGVLFRAAFYSLVLRSCHREVHVGFGSVIVRRSAVLRRFASMGCYCVIGDAEIGEAVMIGSRVSIPSGRRQHFTESGGATAASRFETVRVGARTWVGDGAVILADVSADSIVGAGAVVVKPVPEPSLVVGNPARTVRSTARES
jgi:virginiamycin A acetyltransferase